MGLFNSTNPKPGTHWVGPYSILVANNIQSVVAEDGHNTLDKNSGSTERGLVGVNNMTKQIYLAKYAEFGSDGYYYYKSRVSDDSNDWWTGPYGVKVPSYVTDALMPDEFNLVDKWGNKTNHATTNQILNEKAYLAKYAALGRNGEYYYK